MNVVFGRGRDAGELEEKMSTFELKDVRYVYKTQYQSVEAVKGVSAVFETGRLYAVMGASGSGKTTLLSLMAGLDTPTSGEVLCNGVSTEKMNLSKYRRENVAVIYQDFRLFPLLTVAENIMYPMEQRGIKTSSAREKAAELIARVGLPEMAADRFPAMLSGGEQQRVAIARALGMDTDVLLADEPTGNLDEENTAKIFGMLLDLAHKDGYCVVVVTHDENLGARADTCLRMRDGKLVSHFFSERKDAIDYLSSLGQEGQEAVFRNSTLEDVFVERIGSSLMKR